MVEREGIDLEDAMAASDEVDCGAYLEKFFPEAVARSTLASVSVEVALGLSIAGPGGGRWVCRFGGRRVLDVSRSLTESAEIEYWMDGRTFAAIVSGREEPSAAFFDRRLAIAGNIEMGLKFFTLFSHLTEEFPYRPEKCKELRVALFT